ncbi:hypothetical protein NITLEN_30135 [Nitrospira lenta]|uniref:Uncharacterized protein n=1 Tax=Nitrospira lenta TaxID=1436998 RepID=A0A330L7J6_9BACT|nr:hypothetical protein NITLEN_30135 [Nitrospira lenta]
MGELYACSCRSAIGLLPCDLQHSADRPTKKDDPAWGSYIENALVYALSHFYLRIISSSQS